ncbi:coenzyme F420-0:L-glutamate ligase [Candidatus Sumerlaeota bacterium]|nr:coenzyme F420-0:L-glutamate ligase [Candidatus Sumerlaeota bacterium]
MSARRNPTITVDGVEYLRIPIKTHIVTDQDDIVEVVERYSKDQRKPGDMIVVSESVTAITQGRAIPEDRIKIGLLAKILWRFVRKVPYGVGLRSPATMQCAINETGSLLIISAAIIGALGKLIGRKGDFYRIAGMQAATIDGAHTSPVPPYDKCVILGPRDPDKVASRIRDKVGCEAAIMDINDIGGSWVLGASSGVDKKKLERIMVDNPQGQGNELTPVVLVRKNKQ